MTGCTEIAQRLGGVFGSQCPAGFKLKDEAVFHKQISEVIPEDRAVLISDLQGFLSLDSQANFSQKLSENSGGRPLRLNDLSWIPAFAGMTDPVYTACSTGSKVGFQTASQTVGHPVFVNLLQMPVPKIAMQLKGYLTYSITQRPNALLISHHFALFVLFVPLVAMPLLWPCPCGAVVSEHRPAVRARVATASA